MEPKLRKEQLANLRKLRKEIYNYTKNDQNSNKVFKNREKLVLKSPAFFVNSDANLIILPHFLFFLAQFGSKFASLKNGLDGQTGKNDPKMTEKCTKEPK